MEQLTEFEKDSQFLKKVTELLHTRFDAVHVRVAHNLSDGTQMEIMSGLGKFLPKDEKNTIMLFDN